MSQHAYPCDLERNEVGGGRVMLFSQPRSYTVASHLNAINFHSKIVSAAHELNAQVGVCMAGWMMDRQLAAAKRHAFIPVF